MTEFFVVWKGARSGPFTEEQVISMLDRGEISPMHALYCGNDLVDTQAFLESLTAKRVESEDRRAYQAAAEAREADSVREAAEATKRFEDARAAAGPASLPPAPPSQVTKVEVERDGIVLGQFSKPEIQSGLAAGRFHESDQLWDAVDQTWVSIGSTGEFLLKAKQGAPSRQSTTMKDKKEFAKQMRLNSAYPIFRQVVNGLATIGYAGAAICVLAGIVLWIQQIARQNDAAAWISLLGGFGYGLGVAIMTLLYQGFLVMVADIADSMLDMNSRRNGE